MIPKRLRPECSCHWKYDQNVTTKAEVEEGKNSNKSMSCYMHFELDKMDEIDLNLKFLYNFLSNMTRPFCCLVQVLLWPVFIALFMVPTWAWMLDETLRTLHCGGSNVIAEEQHLECGLGVSREFWRLASGPCSVQPWSALFCCVRPTVTVGFYVDILTGRNNHLHHGHGLWNLLELWNSLHMCRQGSTQRM